MLAKFTILFALLSLVMATGGPILARLQVLPPMVGLMLLALSGVVGIVALLSGVVGALRFQSYLSAMIGATGLLPFLAVLAFAIQGMSYPPINDISTDLLAPPQFDVAPTLADNTERDLSFPEAFVAPIQEAYPDLAPLHLERNPDLIYQIARDLAGQPPFGWTITRDDPKARIFEAVAATRVFGWKDDVIVTVHPEGAGCRVEMRSKSREGKSDLGANARRIRRFFGELQALEAP